MSANNIESEAFIPRAPSGPPADRNIVYDEEFSDTEFQTVIDRLKAANNKLNEEKDILWKYIKDKEDKNTPKNICDICTKSIDKWAPTFHCKYCNFIIHKYCRINRLLGSSKIDKCQNPFCKGN